MRVSNNKVFKQEALPVVRAIYPSKEQGFYSDSIVHGKKPAEACHCISRIIVSIKGFFRDLFHFRIFGNCKIKDADIFCFADYHLDRKLANNIASFIKEHYQEGDIVLIEGLKAGHGLTAHKKSHIPIDPSLFIRGWEPINYKKMIATPSGFKEMQKRLYAFLEKYVEPIPNRYDEKNARWFSLIEKKMPALIAELNALTSYFGSKQWQGKGKTILHGGLEKFRNQPGAYKVLLCMVLNDIEKGVEQARFSHRTKEDVEELKKHIKERNHQMCEEIRKYRTEGKRVFVIAGAAHFLYIPRISQIEDVEEIQSLLASEKFVMVTERRDRFYKKHLHECNRFLWESSLIAG